MNLTPNDFDAFMNAVDDEVTDDWLRETFGHQAEEFVSLDDFTVAEATVLHDAIVAYIHNAQADGDMLSFALGWRLRRKLIESNEQLEEWSMESEKPSIDDAIRAMFRGEL